MAVAHVQTLNAADNDGGTTATGPTITTTAGSLLSCVLYSFEAGAGNPTCSASSFNSVAGTQAITRQHGGTDSRIYIFYWMNVAAVTAAPTFTVSAGAEWTMILTEVSGAATASALDGAGSSATGTSTTPAPTNFTASVTDGFWVNAFGAEIQTGSMTGAGAPWTVPTNGTRQSGGGGEAGVQYYANPGSAGAFNAGWTISSAGWVAAQVVYKAASAAAVNIAVPVGSEPMTGRTPGLGFGINMPDVP